MFKCQTQKLKKCLPTLTSAWQWCLPLCILLYYCWLCSYNSYIINNNACNILKKQRTRPQAVSVRISWKRTILPPARWTFQWFQYNRPQPVNLQTKQYIAVKLYSAMHCWLYKRVPLPGGRRGQQRGRIWKMVPELKIFLDIEMQM